MDLFKHCCGEERERSAKPTTEHRVNGNCGCCVHSCGTLGFEDRSQGQKLTNMYPLSSSGYSINTSSTKKNGP